MMIRERWPAGNSMPSICAIPSWLTGMQFIRQRSLVFSTETLERAAVGHRDMHRSLLYVLQEVFVQSSSKRPKLDASPAHPSRVTAFGPLSNLKKKIGIGATRLYLSTFAPFPPFAVGCSGAKLRDNYGIEVAPFMKRLLVSIDANGDLDRLMQGAVFSLLHSDAQHNCS